MNTIIKRWAKKNWGVALLVCLGSILGLLLLALLLGGPDFMFNARLIEALRQEDEDVATAVKRLGFGFSGWIALVAIYLSNRRAKAMEENVRQMEKNVRQTERSHRQDRFSDAITHLGNPSDSVQLGGAHGLIHLALEDPDRRAKIVEILCAHICASTGEESYQKQYPKAPATRIQKLLSLLFRSEETQHLLEGVSIDLRGAYLRGAELREAKLRGARLSGAQMQGAELQGVLLQGAELQGALLQGENLSEAQLQGANLRQAQLQGANLRQAQLQGANLWQAQLQGANLWQAQLQGVRLWQAQLQGAELSGALLQGASLLGAQLQGADLSEAQLQGTRLEGALLQGINSTKSKKSFFRENFSGWIKQRIGRETDLTGVTFSGGLDEATIKKMCGGGVSQTLKAQLLKDYTGPASHDLPPNSGAIIGTYAQEEAERWIKEYEKILPPAEAAEDKPPIG